MCGRTLERGPDYLCVPCLEARGGLGRDPAKAAALFMKGAESGHARSLYNLGKCWERGEGVKRQSWTHATALYAQASNKGNADAQCDLGLCYHRGSGVPQSWARAVHLFRLAAAQVGRLPWLFIANYTDKIVALCTGVLHRAGQRKGGIQPDALLH